LETKKRWSFVDSKKLVGLEKDVETSMIIQTMNTGKKTLKETEKAKETRK